MPRIDAAPTATPGAPTGEETHRTAPEQAPPPEAAKVPEPSRRDSVLAKLGVPRELATGHGPSPNETVDEPDDEDAAGEQSPATGNNDEVARAEESEEEPAAAAREREGEGTEEGREQQEPEEGEPAAEDRKPGWEQRRIGQLSRQKKELKQQLADAQMENEKLQSQIDQAAEAPVATAPNGNDPLGHITDSAALQKLRDDTRDLKKWCIMHPDGATINGGTDKEQVITPEHVRGWLAQAEDVLEEQIPAKARQLQLTPQYDEAAKAIMPALFDKRTSAYQNARTIEKEFPVLRSHPARHMFIATYLRGLETIQAEANGKQQQNGIQAQRDTNGHAKPSLPEAVRRNERIPLVPNLPARAPSGSPAVPAARKQVADATQNLIQSGGAMNELVNLIKTKRALSGQTPSPRAAATV